LCNSFQVGSLAKPPTWEPIARQASRALGFEPALCLTVFDSESFEVAMRMREIRLRQGLKQAEVARRVGLDPSLPSLWERGSAWCRGAACRRWPLRSRSAWTN
jgi:hypothetical protein